MGKHTIRAVTYLGLFLTIFSATSPVAHAATSSKSAFWWLQPAGSPGLLAILFGVPAPKKTTPSNPSSMRPNLVASPTPVTETAISQETAVVAGWLTPWGDDSFESFKNNLDVLTEVHPFVYTVGADGVSVVPDAGEWHKEEVLRLAKENGIKVIPTISGDVNYSDLMLNDPAKQDTHIDEIMEAIEANSYDGFNIDYEGFLNGYNRDVYANFLEKLSKRIHEKGKILAFSVEAFNRQQDWDRIGKVVDRFMLMGYDYNSARGPQVGPIGPAGWLQEVVDYTATRVPKEKIVLGLGTYGYSWIHDGSQYVSTAVSHQDALDIAAEFGTDIKRDQDAPYFTYDRGQGTRYLYFEDAQSTKPKFDVATRSGIAGIAFWRLGTEDKAIWSDVALTMKDHKIVSAE